MDAELVDCPECGATGNCKICSGDGDYEEWDDDGIPFRVWCGDCRGTGDCWLCSGRKRVTMADIEQNTD